MKTENMVNLVSIDVLDNGKGVIKDLAYDYYNSTMYLCDAIMEHADSSVDIYYSDIEKYLAKNIDKVEEAINECGWEGVGRNLYRAAQIAQHLDIADYLINQEKEIWRQIAYEYLEENHKEVPADLIEDIEDWACNLNNGDRINDMIDKIDDWFADHEKEEEDEE